MIYVSQDDTFETLAYSISLLLGGVLSAWIADKFYKVPFKSQGGKLTFPVMLFVILAAIFWSLSACFLFTSDYGRFPRYYGKMFSLSALQLIGISWLTPIGEELIFRFSILNLLRGKKRDPLQNAGAVLLTAILFGIPHLLAGTTSILDLFLFGCITGFIMIRTRNIVYPICFHFISNLTTMIAYNKLSHATVKDWLWITLPLAVCFLGGMMIAAGKQEPDEDEQDDDEETDETASAADVPANEPECREPKPVPVTPEMKQESDPIEDYLAAGHYDEYDEDETDDADDD